MTYKYNIAINGKWIGKMVNFSSKSPVSVLSSTKFYAVKSWKRYSYALKRAQKEHRKHPKAIIEIFKSWGSYPEQREIVKVYGRKK